MHPISTHEKIKTQIVAFLFNSRADVLRGEMYRALCLHVLNEIDTPCDIVQLTDLVAYAIDTNAQKSSALQTVISDEVTTLVKLGKVVLKDGLYSLHKLEKVAVPDDKEEKELQKTLLEEIDKIARSINPEISKAHINRLFDFYIAVCDIVAKERMLHLAQAGHIDIDFIDFGAISETIERLKIEHNLDKITESEKFINRCFISPNEALSNYVFTLIQVNIIMQLLTWDPSLEYIRENILKGKTLYLDSSILFALMIKAEPTHDFINSLITSSIEELGVNIKVHEDTLIEYDAVVKYHDVQFIEKRLDLAQLALIAKKDNISPRDILSDNIFSDYMSTSIDHVDLGTWQRYTNTINVDSLRKKLLELGVSFDKQSMFVPSNEFFRIRSNMLRASVDHARQNKRSAVKTDGTHDSQLYYLLEHIRQKSEGKFSLGFDTYLLTMDGSLLLFAQSQGIPWAETYFLYPNQWYELAFPFLRVKISQNPEISKNFAAMAFSNIFTELENLIPLQIFGYIFNNGGVDLSLKSIQAVVEALYEQRLAEKLDPTNKNLKEREEAKIRLQRIIAEKMAEEDKQIEKLKSKRTQLKEENKSLESAIYKQQQNLENLKEEAQRKQKELSDIETSAPNREHRSLNIEGFRRRLQSDQQAQIDEITGYYNDELARKEEEITKQRELNEIYKQQLDELSRNVADIKDLLDNSEDRKAQEQQRRLKQMKQIKKTMVIALMLFGVFLSIVLLNQIGASGYLMGGSVVLMAIGVACYLGVKNLWWSFVFFGVGITLTSGLLLNFYKLETLLWLVPMVWEVLLVFVERIFKIQADSPSNERT